jgi:pimeloyl-ACP methyl ester carboxylesterase
VPSLTRVLRCEVKFLTTEFAFNALVTLFVVVDPPGLAPSRRPVRDRRPPGEHHLKAAILTGMSGAPIVIVGGATWWPGNYRNFASLLREISGSEVHIAPLTPLDWTLGYFRGFGQLVFEVASAVDRALLEGESKKAVLVGHSAGGLACRVYIGGDPPYGGRRYSGHRRVQSLITLGTPHTVADKPHLAPITRVNELFPGALHAEAGLRYLSVAGSVADGATSPRVRKRYERFVDDGRVAGDGIVPVDAALLPGSEIRVLDGLHHNRRLGRWYGSDAETVGRWWPQELRAGDTLVGDARAR